MSSPNLRLQATIRTIHLWVGLAVGILFCLMSLSGSLLVFRHDIEHFLRPRWTAHSRARPQSVMTEASLNIRQLWPGATVTSLNLPPAASEPNAQDPYEFDIRLPDGRNARVFADSRSGEVLGTFDLAWLTWLVDLHHKLRLPTAGKQVVGAVGIALFFTSLTGLVMWLTRKPTWRMALRVRTHGSWKLTNFDIHRSAGLAANALLLTVSITGIYLAFPNTIQSALGAAPARTPRKMKVAREKRQPGSAQSKPMEEWIAAARQAVPGGVVRQIKFAENTARGQVAMRIRAPGDVRPEGSNRVTLDPSTARILQVDRASDWSLMKRLTQCATPVHYAEWGGLPMRILWALMGLVPPVLFVSGVLIWLQPYLTRRKYARRKPEADQPTGAGCLTVLGISPLNRGNRSLTVAALTKMPHVCRELQSRDRKRAVGLPNPVKHPLTRNHRF